jgi:hypothetical protein
MNLDRFDDLVVRFSQRRIGRRELLRRAAAGGIGAAAAASTFAALPTVAGQAHAAAAPAVAPVHDPPKPDGWPLWAPWPLPITSGPIIPIPAPAQTTEETGIRSYEARLYPEIGSAWVVGLDSAGQAASHLFVKFGDVAGDSAPSGVKGRELRWAIADSRARAGGTLRVAPNGADGARLDGNLNGQRFAATSSRDGTISIKGQAIAVNAKSSALLAEWSRIGEAFFEIGEELGLTSNGTSTQAGCGGCLGVAIGLSLTAPVCAALIGCGGVWAGTAVVFATECEGACS